MDQSAPIVRPRPSMLNVITAATLFLAGFGYGSWATWTVPTRLWDGLEGLSLVITIAGTLAFGMLAAWALRSRMAPLLPIAGWFSASVLWGVFPGPGGDIVIPGGLPADPGVPRVGEFNWIAGIVVSGIVLFLAAHRYAATAPRRL